MQTLIFFHVLATTLWFGAAASEVVLELVLWRTTSAAKQRAYIELHRIVDVVLEGPALILTVITGFLLLWKRGYLVGTSIWPSWLEDKLICALIVVTLNLACIAFVLIRAKNTEQVLGGSAPLNHSIVRRWHLAVSSTFFAVPFGIILLWLTTTKG